MKSINYCPICGSHDIVPFNNRPNARCANCGGLERTRYLYLLLNRMGLLSPKASILHLAPEPGLFRKLSTLTSGYEAKDYDPSQYVKWSPEVGFANLCDVEGTVRQKYDLILHNHVLEHVPCSVSRVLQNLRERLKPRGIMLFSVPIRIGSETSEDISPEITHEERHARFGQWDHLRLFGDKDVLNVLYGKEQNPVKLIDPSMYLSGAELSEAAVPPAVCGLTGHSIFALEAKNGQRLV